MLEERIRALVQRYLDRLIDRSEFSEQFAGLYFQVRNSRNASLESRNLCNLLMLPFAELSRGDRGEFSFRAELANAVRPFELDRSILVFFEPIANEIFYTPDPTPRHTRWGTATRQINEVHPSSDTESITEPCLLLQAEA